MKSFEYWLKLSENKSKSQYKTYQDKDNDTIIELPVSGNKSEFFIMNLEDCPKEMKFVMKTADPKAWVKSKDGYLYLVSDIQKRINKVTEAKDVTELKAGDKVEITKTGERAKIVSKVNSTHYIIKTKSGEERRVNLNAITPIIPIGKANEHVYYKAQNRIHYTELTYDKLVNFIDEYFGIADDKIIHMSDLKDVLNKYVTWTYDKHIKEIQKLLTNNGWKILNDNNQEVLESLQDKSDEIFDLKQELKDLEAERTQMNIDMENDPDINNPDEKTANDYGDKLNKIDIQIGDIKSKISTLEEEQNQYEHSYNDKDLEILEEFLIDFENKYTNKYKAVIISHDDKGAKFTIIVDGEELLFNVIESGLIYWIDFSKVYMGDIYASNRATRNRRISTNEENSFYFNFDELINTDPNKLDDFVNARKMKESITNESLNVGDEIFFPWSFHNKHLASRGGYIEKIEDGLAYLNMHDNSNKEDMFVPVPVSQIEELINTKNNESNLFNYASNNLKPFEHYLKLVENNESVSGAKNQIEDISDFDDIYNTACAMYLSKRKQTQLLNKHNANDDIKVIHIDKTRGEISSTNAYNNKVKKLMDKGYKDFNTYQDSEYLEQIWIKSK